MNTHAFADLFLLLATLPFIIPVVLIRLSLRFVTYWLEGLQWYYFPQSLPRVPVSHPSLMESATAVAKKIRDGEYTCVEVVSASIKQIKVTNKLVNAVCNNRFDDAIKEAEAVDALIQSLRASIHTASSISHSPAKGQRSVSASANRNLLALFQEKPFLGVPCTVKECFALAGTPSKSSGIVNRRNIIPTEDATCVARMRDAGLIPLCNTNLSEGCMWYESSNALFGRTNNAYDTRHMVGGSSGGEACIISTGSISCGLGSDIGGSIRMPAGFNGIFGHKPSGGLVPSTGQFPGTPYTFLTSGPLCSHSEDLLPLLELMVGPDHVDVSCTLTLADLVPVRLPLSTEDATAAASSTASQAKSKGKMACEVVRWSDVTVYKVCWRALQRNSPKTSTAVEAEIEAAIDKAADTLVSKYGCKGCIELDFPEFSDAFDIWSAVLTAAENNPKFAKVMSDGHGRADEGKLWFAIEILKWCVGASDATLPALILALIEDLPSAFAPDRHRTLQHSATALKVRLNSLLRENNGVLLFPVHPTVAPMHDLPLIRFLNCSFTGIFNVLDVPVTVAPLGLNAAGLPLSMQIVGAERMDRLTIAVAEALERVGVAGWVPPPMLEVPK